MLKTISRFSIIGIFLLLGFSFLFSPLNTSAELNNVLLEDYGNLLTSVDENGDVIEIESLINEGNSSKALGIYIQFIIKLAFGFGSIAAVVLIIYGGIEYIISGTFSKKEGGKKKITHSLGAIALLAISFFFFDIVNPDVLNVRFKPLGGDVVVEGANFIEEVGYAPDDNYFESGKNPTPKEQSIIQFPLNQNYKITQLFGPTKFAIDHPKLYSSGGHSGLDMAYLDKKNTTIYAAESGEILKSPGNTAYGYWIAINHGNINNNKNLSTFYGHLKAGSRISKTKIEAGEKIAIIGNTSLGKDGKKYSTGVHLHFATCETIITINNYSNSPICSTGWKNPADYLPHIPEAKLRGGTGTSYYD